MKKFVSKSTAVALSVLMVSASVLPSSKAVDFSRVSKFIKENPIKTAIAGTGISCVSLVSLITIVALIKNGVSSNNNNNNNDDNVPKITKDNNENTPIITTTEKEEEPPVINQEKEKEEKEQPIITKQEEEKKQEEHKEKEQPHVTEGKEESHIVIEKNKKEKQTTAPKKKEIKSPLKTSSKSTGNATIKEELKLKSFLGKKITITCIKKYLQEIISDESLKNKEGLKQYVLYISNTLSLLRSNRMFNNGVDETFETIVEYFKALSESKDFDKLNSKVIESIKSGLDKLEPSKISKTAVVGVFESAFKTYDMAKIKSKSKSK